MNIDLLKEQYPLQIGATSPILRAYAAEVRAITSDIKKFSYELIELMRAYEGVWLAAPQVWVSQRIAAFTQRDTSKKKRKLLQEGVMINPVVLWQSSEMTLEEEGCLSLPWVTGEVPRPKDVSIQFQTPEWKTVVHHARGYNARILLHEIDHLDGVLFIDKMV